ncbi:hypothetical protein [Nocardia sp. NPDC057668]|uniref:hypothetical protein n=1 Tax=Nocardia sp. NPDC057668 TaxID=3346202 RepID=UPI003671BB64
MGPGELENLRSALSCVYLKLEAETITEPDVVELQTRAEVLEGEIGAILDAEVIERMGERPRGAPSHSSDSADTLF